jgi:hypothetical protein
MDHHVLQHRGGEAVADDVLVAQDDDRRLVQADRRRLGQPELLVSDHDLDPLFLRDHRIGGVARGGR